MAEAELTRQHQAVNWLNRMLATEPAIGYNHKVMVDFYFTKEQFSTIDTNTRSHYKKLVVINTFNLVLVALNQRKWARGMHQMVVQAEAGWESTPQLLMTGMYQSPEMYLRSDTVSRPFGSHAPCSLPATGHRLD